MSSRITVCVLFCFFASGSSCLSRVHPLYGTTLSNLILACCCHPEPELGAYGVGVAHAVVPHAFANGLLLLRRPAQPVLQEPVDVSERGVHALVRGQFPFGLVGKLAAGRLERVQDEPQTPCSAGMLLLALQMCLKLD